MAINVTWADAEQTILRWNFVGRWNWREVSRALDHSRQLLADHDALSAMIYDIRQSGLIPADIVTHLRNTTYNPPAQLSNSHKIVIGADDYLQTFWNTFAQTLPAKCKVTFVDSLDAAYELVEKTRQIHNAHHR